MSQVEFFKPVDLEGLRVEGNSLNEFTQCLKFQLVSGGEVQIVLDRIHKKNMRLSKPAGYIRLLSPELVKLAGIVLAVLSVGAARNTGDFEAKKRVAASALDFYAGQIREIGERLAYNILNNLREVKV